ncbi:MAG: type II toxin-antitoxin system Phd/YefM family antitoxin [Clostridia bacterium]|nr:type II toxin-antitoxin system Phd/YefM family antitoxin [Clostridia bacterium]
MNFYTVRDLRTSPKSIWESLEGDGRVVITNNGKPSALMLDISGGNFEETLLAVKQALAMRAVNNMRQRAANAGYMTDEEIDAEIKAARGEIADAGCC